MVKVRLTRAYQSDRINMEMLAGACVNVDVALQLLQFPGDFQLLYILINCLLFY